MKLSAIASLILAFLSACTPAQVSAFDTALNAGSAALVDATPLACDFLDVTDPANAQAICQVLDDAGNVVTTLKPIVEPIAALTALVKLHPAKSAAVSASLAAVKAKLTVKK